MENARLWLDRELAFSALLHDFRGPLTVLSGVEEQAPALARSWQRLTDLSRNPPRPTFPPRAVDIAALLGLPGTALAQFQAPSDVLVVAIEGLPRAGLELRVAKEVTLSAHGVSVSEGAPSWTLATVEEWFARGGDGLAGARVRVAARLVGARVTFQTQAALARGVLSLHFARG